MKLSEAGAERIANYEGFRADPYWDVDHWSSGYGTRAHGPGDPPITRTEGLRRLRHQADTIFGHAVNELGVALNQHQFDALTSFAYNLGPGKVDKNSVVGKLLLADRYRDAADAMLKYDTAGGQVLAGLTRRRNEERALFLRPMPIRYSDDERAHLNVLRSDAPKAKREDAARWLRKQAQEIQTLARDQKDGWKKYDRGRRYQGIRRALRRYT